MPYAEVAVNSAIPSRQTFTYHIPEGMGVAVGHAVYVPFGRRTLQGIVLALSETSQIEQTRDIESLIDHEPLLGPHQVALAYWLADYYLAPLFDCVSLMLPPGFRRRPLTYLSAAEGAEVKLEELPEAEHAAVERLLAEGRQEIESLRRSLKLRSLMPLVAALERKGLLRRSYELARPRVTARSEPWLRLAVPPEQALAAAEELSAARRRKLAALLQLLANEGPAFPLRELRSGLNLTSAQLAPLLERGLVALEERPVFRDPLASRDYPPRQAPRLTADQSAALAEIVAALEGEPGRFLLHGVTGSGKTEVYLDAIERTVALGKRAIVLVPEISLTPQTVRRFAERFPERVAVMHSALSAGEHFDVWWEVWRGRYDIVIGPRSAVFAPQRDIGLIVLDEEHEWTYKQDEQSPRYHARLVAERLCAETGATLVLGSATPAIESYYGAEHGAYRLLQLPQRLQPDGDGNVAVAPLPEVEVVDLREELKAGNRGIFSRSLLVALKNVLAAQEQAILFLNRRGSASFAQCRDCGHVPACTRCAVAYTYHAADAEASARLVCHHCNRTVALPERCPQCGGPHLRLLGLGTERVEAEVRERFPGVRTIRWDRDVVRRRDDHERILSRFLAHQADVLVGTQMLAKGLDIPRVTLVGVVTADIALHFPDFRSGERAYQLLEQVAGRAGRGPLGGRVIIQTYTPEHPAVQAAAYHSYRQLYQSELQLRSGLGYPPFGRITRLTYVHSNSRRAEDEAFRMTARLQEERQRRGIPNLDVLGPAPAFVPRLRGRWRWNITVRATDPAVLIRDMTFPAGWTIDVDPVSLL